MYISIIAGPSPINPAGREIGASFPVCAETPKQALDTFMKQIKAGLPSRKAPAQSPGDRLDPAFAAQAVAGAYARGGV